MILNLEKSNYLKKFLCEKKKEFIFLMIFYIFHSHKSDIKTYKKEFINNYSKDNVGVDIILYLIMHKSN